MQAEYSEQKRKFGRINWLGTYTLAQREIRRFVVVWTQTLLAPLVTAALFLAIFTVAIGPTRGDVNGVPFLHFIAPGILMMTVIQNAFANTSSSITVAKVQGNIVDTLMPPLSPIELVAGYLAGAIGRGMLVAVVIGLGMSLILGIEIHHPIWALVFAFLGSAMLGGLGILAGVYSNKFDQVAAITNFIVTPLAFLSGTFYSIDALPPLIQTLTRANPIYYLIDGVRYGVLGGAETGPWLGLLICVVTTGCIIAICWAWFRKGYRLKP
ncbi:MULTISPECIES: ABC transporter permease [Halocynthiibacter]|uniref:Transport permease protein n=1 Tax=Halocynthiibacter halioticoli TaxID=2986804 RepID=A0AAE3J2R7_9RHOB|nr:MULTISPECIES: ABC transporter permease [Halocynthiibacter]MCV6825226.1 ABC transporter permease [Halocynthiibacter halioticoli]MCW4058227.1 ABC transporter permease [Halocynthiibacter sp. SDUM655004]